LIVLRPKLSHLRLSIGACLLLVLIACSGTNDRSLEQTFAADPQLTSTPAGIGTGQNNSATLPADFPAEIPRYPAITLQRVQPATAEQPTTLTEWTSPDASDRVIGFYQNALQDRGWQIEQRPDDDRQGRFVAAQADLQITVSIQPQSLPSPVASPLTPSPTPAASSTVLTIEYARSNPNAPVATTSPIDGVTTTPPPGSTNLVTTGLQFTDLDKAPRELQASIAAVAKLGVLPSATTFKPNQTVTRSEFLQWLVAANNRMYMNRPAQNIRLSTEASQPVFQDVPKTSSDFAIIQGAAEAGLIPSSLTGDTTALTFRPNAPLTRETLLLWKVPLDTRRALPSATVDSVRQVWGFQDAAQIDAKALRSVLADHQNGDLANFRRVFGYTTLFQPKRPVTRAEAAAALASFGSQGEALSAQEALQVSQQPESPSPTSSPPLTQLTPGSTPSPVSP
jgi:hypothetical protein